MARHFSESDFSATITRIAVAQICQSVGYSSAQTSALDTLANIAVRYLGAIAHSATASANSSSHTQSNIFDIVIALEELGSVQGFVGAPNNGSSHCLISSSILKEIRRVSFCSDEIPFAQPISRQNRPVESRKIGNEMGLNSEACASMATEYACGGWNGNRKGGEWRVEYWRGFVGEERNQNRMEKSNPLSLAMAKFQSLLQSSLRLASCHGL